MCGAAMATSAMQGCFPTSSSNPSSHLLLQWFRRVTQTFIGRVWLPSSSGYPALASFITLFLLSRPVQINLASAAQVLLLGLMLEGRSTTTRTQWTLSLRVRFMVTYQLHSINFQSIMRLWGYGDLYHSKKKQRYILKIKGNDNDKSYHIPFHPSYDTFPPHSHS